MLINYVFFSWEESRQSRAGKTGPSCLLGKPNRTEDLLHTACSWSKPYDKEVYVEGLMTECLLTYEVFDAAGSTVHSRYQ